MAKRGKIFITILMLSIIAGSIIFAWQAAQIQKNWFVKLSPEEKRQQLILLRDQAIAEAKQRGDYRCCINPPCTMCFWEANQWNNNTPGTCACDDLIAKGEEPCPQCKRGINSVHSEDNIYCDIDATISNCGSDVN